MGGRPGCRGRGRVGKSDGKSRQSMKQFRRATKAQSGLLLDGRDFLTSVGGFRPFQPNIPSRTAKTNAGGNSTSVVKNVATRMNPTPPLEAHFWTTGEAFETNADTMAAAAMTIKRPPRLKRIW